MTDFTEQLKDLGACKDAVEWVNGRSLRKCWQVCDRADWMLWLAEELDIDRRLRVMAACDCAETAQKYADDGGASANTIKVARDWCEGRATTAEVRWTADAAYCVASDAAARAARAATNAVYAARAAADAAAYAAAAAATAYLVDYDAAQKKMAALVRKRISVEVIEEALKEEGYG